jgi:hypothetical protein
VQAWRQPSARRRTAGTLDTAIIGDRGTDVIVLLHARAAHHAATTHSELGRAHLDAMFQA